MSSYKINYRDNGRIDITPAVNKCKFYRIPYRLLESKTHNVKVESDNVVYLLSGKNADNKDCLYVGTSTDGLESRPTSHKSKKVDWKTCIVLTSFDNMLTGAVILHLEYLIYNRINDTKAYKNETEKVTDKATPDEKEIALEVLPTVLEVYDMLGINLKRDPQNTLISHKMEVGTTFVSKTDYSKLKLHGDMVAWLEEAEKSILAMDDKLEPNVTTQYASFKYPGVSKTIAYFYPIKPKKQFRVLLHGTPDWYSDPKVTERPDTMHNGKCKAMFIINGPEDLGYLRLFAEIAIKKSRSAH